MTLILTTLAHSWSASRKSDVSLLTEKRNKQNVNWPWTAGDGKQQLSLVSWETGIDRKKRPNDESPTGHFWEAPRLIDLSSTHSSPFFSSFISRISLSLSLSDPLCACIFENQPGVPGLQQKYVLLYKRCRQCGCHCSATDKVQCFCSSIFFLL